MNFLNRNHKILFVALILLAFSLSRVAIHPWNFTPMTAIMIFSGVLMPNKNLRYLLPVSLLLLTDAIIGQGNVFYSGWYVVYLSYLATIYIASKVIASSPPQVSLIGPMSIGASILFFLTTNNIFFYPVSNSPEYMNYPHNLSGLLASYTAGMPFFRTALAGDLFYTILMFSTYYLINYAFKKVSKIA